MSLSRRRQHSRSNAPAHSSAITDLSGAEMLVLQQNIKQYIITSQTRALTAHELEEFEKVKQQLLPSLLRYSQLAEPSLTGHSTECSSRQVRMRELQTSGKATTPSQTQPSIYPMSQSTRLSMIKSENRMPTLVTEAKARPATKSKRKIIKEEPLLSSSSSTILRAASSQSTAATATRGVANASKGDRKRSKIDVYQDRENASKKKPRLRNKNNAEDSDKENKNPFDQVSSKAKKVLGDSTNTASNTNNILNNNYGKGATKAFDVKGKGLARKPVISNTDTQSNVASATLRTTAATKLQTRRGSHSTPVSSTNTDTKSSTRARKAQTRKTTAQSRLPAVQSTAEAQVEGTEYSTQDQKPFMDTPAEAIESARHASSQCPINEKPESRRVGQQSQQPVIKKEPESLRKPTPRPQTATECGTITEVLASVDDDELIASIHPKEEAGLNAASKGEGPLTAVDYEEVQDSEPEPEQDDLQNLYSDGEHHAEEEATFPAPHFLLDAPEVGEEEEEEATFPMPHFLLRGAPEDQQEAAEMPESAAEVRTTLSDFVPEEGQPISVPSSTDVTIEFRPEASSNTSVAESTNLVDGVWCIEDFKGRVTSTVCGHQEQWIAVETTSQVEFWQLDGHDVFVESKWRRRIQQAKSKAHPVQIVFAPDDSFALVLAPADRSCVRVPLEEADIMQEPMIGHYTFTWRGTAPSLGCGGFIVQRKLEKVAGRTGHYLVFGAEEPGSLCLIPIPENDAAREMNVLAETVRHPGTSQVASSVVKVFNTPSLVLASFAATMVLWDLDDPSTPVSIADATAALSLIRSPSLTAPPMKPTIMSARVPVQFFDKRINRSQVQSQPPSQWPILMVLMTDDTDVSMTFQDESERCALYTMTGGNVEIVHKYHGSGSISLASSSSQFVACQKTHDGIVSLFLWNLLHPKAVAQFSLLDPPTEQGIAQQKQSHLESQTDYQEQHKDAEQQGGTDLHDLHDIFSDVSTLSAPPAMLSSPPYASFVGKTLVTPKMDSITDLDLLGPANVLERLSRLQTSGGGGIEGEGQEWGRQPMRQPREWINLTSISLFEQQQVQFSVQVEQHWVVVVQQGTSKQHPSVVHIMDLASILPPACA